MSNDFQGKFSDGPQLAVGSVRGLRTWSLIPKMGPNPNPNGPQYRFSPDGSGRVEPEPGSVVATITGVTLQGQYGFHWEPGENVAVCKPTRGIFAPTTTTGHGSLSTYTPDAPPMCKGIEPHCTCGFYAFWTPDTFALNGGMTSSRNIWGVVEGYGKTVFGEYGFRCEKAKIVALVVPDQRHVFTYPGGTSHSILDRARIMEYLTERFPGVKVASDVEDISEWMPEIPEELKDHIAKSQHTPGCTCSKCYAKLINTMVTRAGTLYGSTGPHLHFQPQVRTHTWGWSPGPVVPPPTVGSVTVAGTTHTSAGAMAALFGLSVQQADDVVQKAQQQLAETVANVKKTRRELLRARIRVLIIVAAFVNALVAVIALIVKQVS